jgi:hypothetical protein
MGIRFHCPHCRGKLHVKSFLAGKQGICPHCEQSLKIPEASEPPVAKVPESIVASPSGRTASRSAGQVGSGSNQADSRATTQSGPQSASRSARHMVPAGPTGEKQKVEVFWYVRPPEGGEYGPAEPHVMQQWVSEGRVSGEALVWRTGWANWRVANSVFLEIPSSPPAGTSDQGNRKTATSPAAGSGDDTALPSPLPEASSRASEGVGAPVVAPPGSTNNSTEGHFPERAVDSATTPLPQAAGTSERASGAPVAPATVPQSDSAVAPAVVPVQPSGKGKVKATGVAAGRMAARSRRRRGDRKGWWVTAVVLLALTSVALLITLLVVLMNQTS